MKVLGPQQTQENRWISIAGDVKHQNIDRTFRAFDLFLKPVGTDLKAFLGVCTVKEERHVVLLNPLESSFELALPKRLHKLVVNGM